MRLIDADKLKKHYEWWKDGTEEHTLDEMREIFNTIVDLQPTIIEAEEGNLSTAFQSLSKIEEGEEA